MTIFRYCNSRVSVFDGTGRHLHDIEGDWTVVHSLALYEQVTIIVIVIIVVDNFVHCLDLCTNDFYHAPNTGGPSLSCRQGGEASGVRWSWAQVDLLAIVFNEVHIQ